MGRLLLSSSQVSVLLSSLIVFSFTLALFLSGYVLQQRYVHNLQAVIKPRLPKPLPPTKPLLPPTLDVKWAHAMGSRPDMDDSYEKIIARETQDWSRLGYVQVVKAHGELCSAVMLLSDLHRMRSPAARVLMFPKSWLKDAEDGQSQPEMETTRRLLRTAARRYGVILRPMEPIRDGLDETTPSSYSLASVYSLAGFERLLYLQGPGILLDASAIDSLLAFSKSEALSAYPADDGKSLSTSLLMIHPSQETFSQLKQMRPSGQTSDIDLLRLAFKGKEYLLPEWMLSIGNIVYESSVLRQAAEDFNATLFKDTTTFVRLTDPELPGPEYDVPFWTRAQIRPKNDEAGDMWSALYERFRQQRMDVCGLDLAIYQPVQTATGQDSISQNT